MKISENIAEAMLNLHI